MKYLIIFFTLIFCKATFSQTDELESCVLKNVGKDLQGKWELEKVYKLDSANFAWFCDLFHAETLTDTQGIISFPKTIIKIRKNKVSIDNYQNTKKKYNTKFIIRYATTNQDMCVPGYKLYISNDLCPDNSCEFDKLTGRIYIEMGDEFFIVTTDRKTAYRYKRIK